MSFKSLNKENNGDYSPRDVIGAYFSKINRYLKIDLQLSIGKLIELGYLFEHTSNK